MSQQGVSGTEWEIGKHGAGDGTHARPLLAATRLAIVT